MKIQKHSAIMNLINGIDMRLGYVGYAVVGTKWRSSQLATPFNRLYLIESGSGVLSAGGQELVLEPGNAYLLPADLPCSYRCDDSLSLLFFHFNLVQGNQVDLMRQVKFPARVRFSAERFAYLREICEKSSYTDAFEVICNIQSIVLEMSRTYGFNWDALPVYSHCVSTAISTIHQQLSAQLRIEDIAKECFISRSYLARQFKKEVGMTIKQYILMQLINSAQWQLSHTDTSVEKISHDLGFCNQFYFSECFKKHCRVSPLQYRNGTKY